MTKREPMTAREAWIICDSNVAENEAEMLRARVIMRHLVEAHEADVKCAAIQDDDQFDAVAFSDAAEAVFVAKKKLRALERGEDQT